MGCGTTGAAGATESCDRSPSNRHRHQLWSISQLKSNTSCRLPRSALLQTEAALMYDRLREERHLDTDVRRPGLAQRPAQRVRQRRPLHVLVHHRHLPRDPVQARRTWSCMMTGFACTSGLAHRLRRVQRDCGVFTASSHQKLGAEHFTHKSSQRVSERGLADAESTDLASSAGVFWSAAALM